MSSCNYCKKPATQQCGRCMKTYYCNKECQRADYSSHKISCIATLPSKSTETSSKPKNTCSINLMTDLMADLFAVQSLEDIATLMKIDSPFKRQKDAINLRLKGGALVRKLFLQAVKRNPSVDINTNRGFELLYYSMEALGRCLDFKEQKNDFLSLQPMSVGQMLSSWPTRKNVEQYENDPNMIYVCVCTFLPLSALRSDLKDMVITHCVTVIERRHCSISEIES